MLANRDKLSCEPKLDSENRYNYEKDVIVSGVENDIGLSHITNKRILLKAITIMMAFIIAFASVSCGAAPAEQRTEFFKLYLDITSDKNALFNKYAITINIDGQEIGSVDNGENFTYEADVIKGDHTIEFCKEGKEKPKVSTTITLDEDTSYSCLLKHDGFAIKIKDEAIDSFVSGIDNIVVTEQSSETIVETTETESLVTTSTETESIVTEETTIIESSPTTSSEPITGPTTLSENITGFSFSTNKEIMMYLGDDPYTGTVRVTMVDESSFSPSDVFLISDNPDVVTIECTDYFKSPSTLIFAITPVSLGETYIYAKASDGKKYSERIKVVVKEYIEVDSIWIEESCSLNLGESHLLSSEITPENATNKLIKWTSNDDSVVTVNDRGFIKAVGLGDAEITATTPNGASATCYVSVGISQREMTLKYSISRNQGDFIGRDWAYAAYVDEESAVNGTYTFNSGENLVFRCWAEEQDSVPDVGETTEYYTVSDEDLLNGFTVEVVVYVTENRGKNAGKTAVFTFTFTFSPA